MNHSKTGNNEADKILVNRVLSGDTVAFTTIVKNTEALVTQIVFKMITNTADHKDLAQEIYLKVYKNLSGFQFHSKLSTWIAQITYNACFDHLRKKKLVLPDNLYEEDNTLTGPVYERIFFLEQKELRSVLAKELKQLPPVYQTLVTLFHREEMSYMEITEITGLPEGTVKSYLFRARKMLKENLSKRYQKEDI